MRTLTILAEPNIHDFDWIRERSDRMGRLFEYTDLNPYMGESVEQLMEAAEWYISKGYTSGSLYMDGLRKSYKKHDFLTIGQAKAVLNHLVGVLRVLRAG